MIDWDRICELFEDFGEDGFAEVADVFVIEARESLDRLAQASKPEQMRAEFHFIKGAAMTLGFDQIAAICAEGEMRAENGLDCLAQKTLVMEALPPTCDRFQQEWRSRLGSRQPG